MFLLFERNQIASCRDFFSTALSFTVRADKRIQIKAFRITYVVWTLQTTVANNCTE